MKLDNDCVWSLSSPKHKTTNNKYITMVQCLFYERLNCHQQKCQMDVNIYYCDGEKNVAQSVYYDSRFLQRRNAVNLKREILNAIKYLVMGKFLLINDHQVANGF